MRFLASFCRSCISQAQVSQAAAAAQAAVGHSSASGAQRPAKRGHHEGVLKTGRSHQQLACFCLSACSRAVQALQHQFDCSAAVPLFLYLLQVGALPLASFNLNSSDLSLMNVVPGELSELWDWRSIHSFRSDSAPVPTA